MPCRDFRPRAAAAMPLAALAPHPAAAEEADAPVRSARECDLYARAWADASAGDGLDGIGPAFLAAHDASPAPGCRDRHVCPVTAPERSLADTLSLMAAGEGMTGSFPLFSCP